MFGGLSEKLSQALKIFKNKGRVTEKDVKEGMRAVKMALLEADVNYTVVKEFTNKVSERCVGSEVLESLVPFQQIIKIVNEELTSIMGSTNSKLTVASNPPTVIMACGLQGAGKTTNCGKLAALLKKQGKNPLLVACDVYRPAAVDQLKIVGEKVGISVYSEDGNKKTVEIAKHALAHAKKNLLDTVIVDTAGRLHIDEEMMDELKNIKKEVSPHEILLFVDAMTGQDAVTVAKTFDELLDITGVVMTKMDGDTRGGAALSVKYITGKPIKFIGTGEKLDEIEPFHPDRMANRILGMGDMLTLIEKAQQNFDEKKAAELEEKIRKQRFTLDDYLDQMQQLKNMGSLESMAGMIPGMNAGQLKDAKVDEKMMARNEAIIKSMTVRERTYPDILNYSRRKRIAAGSGTKVEDVNKLIKQYDAICKMMKQFSKNGGKGFGRGGMPFKF